MVCACAQTEAPAQPLSPGQAAVIIDFGDGRFIVRVAELAQGSATGRDLLLAGGLDLLEKGGFVCRIGDLGCELAECPCMGAYWSYWHWQDGGWSYANTGAGGYRAEAGAVDAWRWNTDDDAPATIEPVMLFDANRLAPGVPQAAVADGVLELKVDFQGDVNNNARVAVEYIPPQGIAQTVVLQRSGGQFGARPTGTWPSGEWQVRFHYEDPDGVNGSTSWPLGPGVLETE
jgi:hypothetical protein